MKKLLLSLSLILSIIAVSARNRIEFTFSRSANTVIVNGRDGVTATIAVNPDSYLTSSNAGRDDILTINRNTNSATADDPNSYTLTIHGLDDTQSYDQVIISNVGVAGSGEWQGNAVTRQRNFVIGFGSDAYNLTSTEPALKYINDETHCYGTAIDNEFDIDAKSENGNLVIKVSIYTDGGLGCFYGLTKITLVEAEEENTSSIEDIEEPDNKADIYDIHGHRINEITEHGIYIVNGKKILAE